MAHGAELVLDARAMVGESPVWDAQVGLLWWTDIAGMALHRLDPTPGFDQAWPMPEEVGCFALRERGGLVVAMRNGFAFLDLTTNAIERIGDPEAHLPHQRFNDGKCDRRGRFWAGTMNEPRTERTGALYRLDADRTITRMADGVLVANGLAWSADDRLMYWSDSRSAIVWVFDYDPDAGAIRNRREFSTIAGDKGRPDGAAVDSEGCYWSARFGGGRVIRFTPEGTIDREILLPVSRVTMCAFGGRDLRTLYITTAREGMGEADLAREPLAGGVFAADAGVAGLPEPRFAG